MSAPLHISIHSPLRRSQRGVTLVEVMVSLAIGLVVIGAVFANYLNNAAGARYTAALAQVTSNASIALGIMRNHIAMAGFAQPNGIDTSGMTVALTQPAIVGCDNGFTKASDTAAATDVTCNAAKGDATDINSVLVRYEADTALTPTSGTGAAAVPTDCAGNGLTATLGRFEADNRFQVALADLPRPTALTCRGNGNTGRRDALVEGIQEMHLQYGIGKPDTAKGKLLFVTSYVKASDVAVPAAAAAPPGGGAAPAPAWLAAWDKVMAVRICVVSRSEEEVLPQKTPYLDCDQQTATPPDRRIYRAFTSTVLLNNRLSSLATTTP